MPVYRGERYVAAAIASVLRQSYPSFELIIVNDGSPDDSDSQIRQFLPHPKICYIKQDNAGVANARNAGIEASTGEFVALLDQDDLWLPSKLETQMSFLSANPDVALAHSRVECIDANGNPRSCEGAIQVVPFEGSCVGKLLAGNAIAPLTVVMRRTCLSAVGSFDQEFAPADDWELWLRLARKYKLGFVDHVTAQYRFHGENVSGDQLVMHRAVLRTMNSICERFPDIPDSLSPLEFAELKSRMLKHMAELLARRGKHVEAFKSWKSAYMVNGDFEALLGLMALPSSLRGAIGRALARRPSVERRLQWYSTKAANRLSRLRDAGGRRV